LDNADKKIYSWQKIKNLKSSGIRDFMEIQWDSGFHQTIDSAVVAAIPNHI